MRNGDNFRLPKLGNILLAKAAIILREGIRVASPIFEKAKDKVISYATPQRSKATLPMGQFT